MSRADDLAYFSRRYAEEMARGDQAASASIAAIHYDLAHRYSLIVRANECAPAFTPIGSGTRRGAPNAFLPPDSPDERLPDQGRIRLSQNS